MVITYIRIVQELGVRIYLTWLKISYRVIACIVLMSLHGKAACTRIIYKPCKNQVDSRIPTLRLRIQHTFLRFIHVIVFLYVVFHRMNTLIFFNLLSHWWTPRMCAAFWWLYKVSMSISVQVFLRIYAFVSLGYISDVGLLDHSVDICLTYVKLRST